MRRLAGWADVLVENFRPGDLKRYGLDYASLSPAHPRLIYCSISGFGQTGPGSHLPGYDLLFQGFSGLMSVIGAADGEPGAGPQRVGCPLIDMTTSLFAVGNDLQFGKLAAALGHPVWAADPQVRHNGLLREMGHPAGRLPVVGSPLKFSDSPVTYDRPPRLLGQHTDEVLRELGFDDMRFPRAAPTLFYVVCRRAGRWGISQVISEWPGD